MKLSTAEELAEKYQPIFDNEDVRKVFEARLPNKAVPVDEARILAFIEKTNKAHASFVVSIMEDLCL